MNLKSLFRGPAAFDKSPTAAMAKRVSTREGCESLADELSARIAHLETIKNTFSTRQVLSAQVVELNRLALVFRMGEERARVSAEVQSGRNDAGTRLKEATRKCEKTGPALAAAELGRADMEKRIKTVRAAIEATRGQSSADLERLTKEAQRLIDAEAPESEQRAALDAVRKARQVSGDARVDESFQIEALENSLARLVAAEADAKAANQEAVLAQQIASYDLLEVAFDEASGEALEAYLRFKAAHSKVAQGSQRHMNSLRDPEFVFRSAQRCPMGNSGLSDVGVFRKYWLDALAEAYATPPNLELLIREASGDHEQVAADELAPESLEVPVTAATNA